MAALALVGGCTPASLVITAVGVATDTSVTWSIVKHLHAKATEGDPVWCIRLNSVERALSGRCGEFVAGSIKPRDIETIESQDCPLTRAARDPELWPVLPELLEKGARRRVCLESPLLALAQAHPCPDFESTSPEVLGAIRTLAETDARAVRHDIVRMLTCPKARAVGLHQVLDRWLATRALNSDHLGFGLLGALHPDFLASSFAQRCEALGHTAQASMGPFEGKLATGFEEALRLSHWSALEWWFSRMPQLVDRVPPRHAKQVHWLPLARVLVPTFLEWPETQAEMIGFLVAHGANPRQALPYDPGQTVLGFARQLGSPHVALLDPAALPIRAPTTAFAADGGAPLHAGRNVSK